MYRMLSFGPNFGIFIDFFELRTSADATYV